MEELERKAEKNHYPPFSVRVVALFLIALGVCGAVVGLPGLWTGRHAIYFPLSIFGIAGWALLRRRNYVRHLVLGVLMILLVIAVSYAYPIYHEGSGSLFLKWLLAFVTLCSLVCGLMNEHARRWFKEHPPITPLFDCNPRNWRFSTGLLLYLTMLVALSVFLLTRSNQLGSTRAELWIASLDLSDPVHFPAGASSSPISGPRTGTQRLAGKLNIIEFSLLPNQGLSGEPVVVEYVVFHSAKPNESWGTIYKNRTEDWYSGSGTVTFMPAGLPEITFPGPAQIAEYRDGELFTSELQITALEFWSFCQHPNSEWSIEGIERYVKDLRKRVAERE